MDELELRDLAKSKLRSGDLPSSDPARVWAGPGVGAPCALCDRPIDHAQLEYETQFFLGPRGLVPYRFHMICHAVWQLERIFRR
jgi:hypothetical protein